MIETYSLRNCMGGLSNPGNFSYKNSKLTSDLLEK